MCANVYILYRVHVGASVPSHGSSGLLESLSEPTTMTVSSAWRQSGVSAEIQMIDKPDASSIVLRPISDVRRALRAKSKGAMTTATLHTK